VYGKAAHRSSLTRLLLVRERKHRIRQPPAIPPVFHPVYPYPGRVNVRYKQSVNGFLTFWFKNLKAQGFGRAGRRSSSYSSHLSLGRR
jgi:hypothetical protein